MNRLYYALGACLFIGMVIFGIVEAQMAGGGDVQALRESAREAEADWVGLPLQGALDDMSSLELAEWQAKTHSLKALSDLQAEVVLVTFWASYCEPCKREWPSMVRLAESFGPKKLAVVSVSYDEDWDEAREFFKSHFGFLPPVDSGYILRDKATQTADMLKTSYGTDKIPETYVLKKGRVLYRIVNERNWISPRMTRFFERLMHADP
jgi:thiol-disulfide isomerase/thioredoxin